MGARGGRLRAWAPAAGDPPFRRGLMVQGLGGFGVSGLGFRVLGLGFRVCGFRIQG